MDGMGLLHRFQIGDTPLIPMPELVRKGHLLLKAELMNPFGSVKDRTAAYLLAWARKAGGPDVRVVESTSGNLGFALLEIGRRMGIRSTLVLDISLPSARIEGLGRAGADMKVVTAPRAGLTYRETRMAVAAELGQREGYVWLNQYANCEGVRAHEETTGPEIWRDRKCGIDAVVASVGTGGTICGIAAAMRGVTPTPTIVGVEPLGSTISGGIEGDYLPAGSGMRGRPDTIDTFGYLIDWFAQVPDAVAARWALTIRNRCGIEVGPTTGAAVAVAALISERDDCSVVAIAPDRGSLFVPAMRQLAATDVDVPDVELIQMQPFNAYGSAQTADTVCGQVGQIIADLFPWAADTAPQSGASLRADLELDSLHLVELQVAVEDRFRVLMDPMDTAFLDAFVTVGSLAAYVHHLLQKDVR